LTAETTSCLWVVAAPRVQAVAAHHGEPSLFVAYVTYGAVGDYRAGEMGARA
jgi:hypothetical protein